MELKRGLNRREAAAYCGANSLSTFSSWIRKGIIPGPIPGTRIWDKQAIDRKLTEISKTTTIPSSPLDEWKASRARSS